MQCRYPHRVEAKNIHSAQVQEYRLCHSFLVPCPGRVFGQAQEGEQLCLTEI